MEDGIWIGQDGSKHGPYSESDVRHWLSEGRFGRDTVAWREGMADWVPLATLLAGRAGRTAPPPAPPAGPAPDRGYESGRSFAENTDTRAPRVLDRNALSPPPSLHWALVLLFTILTLGIFGIVWPFIQASWAGRVDPHSNARLYLGASLGSSILGYGLDSGMPVLGGALQLVSVILFVLAYFSMAASIRQCMAPYRVPVEIGGVTLFVFNTLYLQGQLSWLANWQRTGRTTTKAPKGIFWALLTLPAVAIVAATALPAYQVYVMRSQVAGVLAEAEALKTQVAEATGRIKAWPATNAQAGLKEPGEYAHGNLAGFGVQAVYDGTALVAVFSDSAPAPLRRRQVALVAHAQEGAIVWSCESPDIEPRYLPVACR